MWIYIHMLTYLFQAERLNINIELALHWPDQLTLCHPRYTETNKIK